MTIGAPFRLADRADSMDGDRSSRRGFLGQLLALPLGMAAVASPKRRYYSLGQFFVAGFQYHDGPTIAYQLKPGQVYALEAEPSNPYDELAVAIYRGSAQLGYVPRADNRSISRLLQQGVGLRCVAIAVDPLADPWKLLRVDIQLPA